MIREFGKLDKILLALVAVGGGAMLFFPVQQLLIGLVGLIVLIYLLLNPKHCFYLMLILSTCISAFATESQQMPFNQTDILIAICFFSTLCRFIFIDNAKVNLRTKIDVWLIVLLLLYFFSGMTSISHRGYQGFLKMGEVIAVFYMTVYFLRTKIIKLSELIKVVLFIGVFQAILGMFQSITGIGATFRDNRGYLGYLGIGSSMVWHGQGTFGHFNSLGPFLSTLFLFYLPINYFLVKNKKRGYIVLSILFFGLITTYSRGSLMALIAGSVFFLYQIQKDKKKFLLKLTPLVLFIFTVWRFLKNTSYVSTIAPRNDMWALALNSITSSTKNLLFGSGLKSYEEAVFPYLPGNIPLSSFGDFYAHNFFLSYTVELGLFGLSIIVAFLLNILFMTYKKFKSGCKLSKSLSLSVSLIIFAIFLEGMFDHAFNMFVFQVWLYLFFGILYSKCLIKEGIGN